MTELIEKVQELVAFELDRANTIHPPKFNSYHEAYEGNGESMKRITYPCEDCGRTGVLRIIWRVGVYHCPSCGCYKIGTVQRVDEVEMDKEVADETERTN